MIRGVRGAITVDRNDPTEIVERAHELLREIVGRNGIRPDEVASVIFTVTDDLDAEFPAQAARGLDGWEAVPLLCAREIPVPGSLDRCLRVLVHWNTDRAQGEVRHVYLRGSDKLRPDLG